ncbi:uncharacterized protein METZ01_LOCUS21701 [marine metagenome]|jgi:F-type H+-transporting ATPase subunit b|uniref:ATP synthase YMF19-like N-terminal domain-containing protein n=1 Tax=marine metagenome TaxID=408172 RepID=A0A381PRY4_9ZZZZ|tara:strand:+ start:171 stop:650 length:480 start_codon:yes stop_codon:yes gene_type:complete
MPQLDFSTFVPQLFWLFLSLSFLYLILSRIALPRISDVIEERKDIIAQDIDKAKALSNDTDLAIEELDIKIAEAKSKSLELINSSRKKILDLNDSEKRKFDEEISKEIKKAEDEILINKDLAMSRISEIAEEITAEMLSNILPGEVDKKSLEKLSKDIN